jgi:saccharopine dehydrogenase-like NADP-dependent oxidoreductase
MPALRVVVIGGYGFFGRRLVQRLAPDADLQLLVAGRSLRHAQATADALGQPGAAEITGVALDASAPTLANDLARLEPDLAVLASGPFQGAGYDVARACTTSTWPMGATSSPASPP